MEKLERLLSKCNSAVYLTVNEHKNCYETAKEALEQKKCLECPPDIEEKIREVMIDNNTIIHLQFYPHTPIGSYSIYHYDLEMALDEALNIMEQE
tara:strand:- start:7338 stop:7622 length:285 start_codon:yes stop_codon:yes gene_type:complete